MRIVYALSISCEYFQFLFDKLTKEEPKRAEGLLKKPSTTNEQWILPTGFPGKISLKVGKLSSAVVVAELTCSIKVLLECLQQV